MNDYRISVVIPNYNNEKFLRNCVSSIANQTYKIEKIIIVDDCSTDSSLDILYELSKTYSNLQIIPLEKNGKVSHARNVGLTAVETPYVTFIDADDIYYSNKKIENEMNLIRYYKERHNKDIISYSRIMQISQNGTTLVSTVYPEKYYNQGDIFEDILTEKHFFTVMRDYCMPVKFLRDVGGYDEKSSFWEDLDLILKLSKNIEFYYTNEPGTGYRQGGIGLSKRPKEEHVRRRNEIFNQYASSFSVAKKMRYRVLRKLHKAINFLIIYRLRIARKLNKIKATRLDD